MTRWWGSLAASSNAAPWQSFRSRRGSKRSPGSIRRPAYWRLVRSSRECISRGVLTHRRGIYYAARDAKTCLAEAFQATRRIDRVFQAPWLVVFETLADLKLLDLMGDFATRVGASIAIHSGSRGRARGWARDLCEAYPEIQGILYAAPMHGGQHAIALNGRALKEPFFPTHPLFHRALADDVMLDPLKHAARGLGYALR